MRKKDIIELFYAVAVTSLVIFFGIMISDANAVEKAEFNFSDAQYLRTIDGDTFKVSIYCIHPIFGENLSVRLRGANTPELYSRDPKQKAVAIKAKAYVKDILENGKDLRLKDCYRGSLSRIVCNVSNSKTKDLGAELIEKKLATKW